MTRGIRLRNMATSKPRGPSSLVKSKQRVVEHGEVFTPAWVVDAMLDLVKSESERIESRVLEPACGSGNFLVRVLARKLAAVESRYATSAFERRHFAILSLMCIYGIELLADNIVDCRENMLEIFADYLDVDQSDVAYRAGFYVLSQNLVHGDALSMVTSEGQAITFAEWGYLGAGRFQRRDFRFDALAHAGAHRIANTRHADPRKHEDPSPTRIYPPATAADLAKLAMSESRFADAGEW